MAISENKQDLRVLVVTPLGKGGMGGIDRIMDDIRPRVASPTTDGVVVDFIASRGQGSIALAPLHMAATLARLGAARLGIGRVDVVHINLSSHGSALRKLAIAKAAHWLGLPYIIHLHGSGFRKYWDAAPAPLALRIRQMFAGAARILVLGRVWRDYVAGQAPEAAKLIVILPNASSAPPPALLEHAKEEHAPVILFLGHVGPRKGVPELLLALAALPKSPGWRAIIAGNGAVEQARAEIARLGLADRVEAPGWVGPDQVRGLLAASDIVVLPSHEENLPMSVIEGMAFGRAVVATPVGAVEDIIEDGKTGLLVPVGDADALAKALTRLVADPALRASLGGAAAAFHRANLDMELYVARLKSLWGEAARERRA